jgi:hypothetical protein
MTPTATTTTPQVSERRRFVRVPTNCHVIADRIHYSAKVDTKTLAEARNISANGLLFVAGNDFQLDEQFKVAICLSRDKSGKVRLTDCGDSEKAPLTAICRVVRSKRLSDGMFEIGAEFERVYQEDLLGLKDFLAQELKA